MHEILHVIGLCPDNMTHPDLLDFILVQRDEFVNLFSTLLTYVRRSFANLQRYVYTILC